MLGVSVVTAREPDPIAPGKACPSCQQPAREADQRTEYVADKPWICDICDLFFTGTAPEFQRYRIAESVALAEAMTTSPRPKETDR